MSDDLGFHYKREERLGMRGAPEPRSTRGWSPGRGRRPLILAVNLVLVVTLFVLYARPRGAAAGSAELSGWRVTLRGVPAGRDVLAVLEVSAAEAGGATSAGDGRLYVLFRAGDAELPLSEVLPAAGGSLTLSGRLVEAGEPRELSAEVGIGASRAKLRRALTRD